MANKDGYVSWCSACKADHAGECAKPGEASGRAIAAAVAAMEDAVNVFVSPYPTWILAWLPQPGQGNTALDLGQDTTGSCPDPVCTHCNPGKPNGT